MARVYGIYSPNFSPPSLVVAGVPLTAAGCLGFRWSVIVPLQALAMPVCLILPPYPECIHFSLKTSASLLRSSCEVSPLCSSIRIPIPYGRRHKSLLGAPWVAPMAQGKKAPFSTIVIATGAHPTCCTDHVQIPPPSPRDRIFCSNWEVKAWSARVWLEGFRTTADHRTLCDCVPPPLTFFPAPLLLQVVGIISK